MNIKLPEKGTDVKSDACYYSNGIVCETRKDCPRCGWNPDVDKTRRKREHRTEKHWWADPDFVYKPIETERVVLEKGL